MRGRRPENNVPRRQQRKREYETILGAVTFLALLCLGYAYYELGVLAATTRALPVILAGYVAQCFAGLHNSCAKMGD